MFWISKIKIDNFRKRVVDYKTTPFIIILIGIALRFVLYLYNRSLSHDEAALALNLINKSYLELIGPLDYRQAAPFGFLMLEKLSITLFGDNEYSLRLFPLLFGIGSLFLFYSVARKILKKNALLISLSLFAISNPLVTRAAFIKQYSADTFVTLMIYFIIINFNQTKKSPISKMIIIGMIGGILIWFSYPSIFILTGIALGLVLISQEQKEMVKISRFLIAFLLWVISFIVFYLIAIRNSIENEALHQMWSRAYMPFPPSTYDDLLWFPKVFLGIFHFPTGVYPSIIGALLFIIGTLEIFRNKKRMFYLLIIPIIVTLLASGIQLYPFKKPDHIRSGRVLFFIAPMLIILIGAGVERIMEKTKKYPIISIVLISLLFLYPIVSTSQSIFYSGNEIKHVMKYVEENKRSEDVFYVQNTSEILFRFYSKDWNMNGITYSKILRHTKKRNSRSLKKELRALRGNENVWFVFSNNKPENLILQEEPILSYLDSLGMRKDSISMKGASAYLYDLPGK
jgi:4-amino-4-deoxy-L-arabinose transferase-like glycosyltransferase